MNPVAEYRFLLGQYVRLMAERAKPQDLTKVRQRLDELWAEMTEAQQRSIWR